MIFGTPPHMEPKSVALRKVLNRKIKWLYNPKSDKKSEDVGIRLVYRDKVKELWWTWFLGEGRINIYTHWGQKAGHVDLTDWPFDFIPTAVAERVMMLAVNGKYTVKWKDWYVDWYEKSRKPKLQRWKEQFAQERGTQSTTVKKRKGTRRMVNIRTVEDE